MTNSEIRTLIDEHVHSKRNREILKLRLIDGVTYASISATFDLSDRQVKYIVQKFSRKFHL